MGEVETEGTDADKITAMPEYRKFRTLLRKVIKAPPSLESGMTAHHKGRELELAGEGNAYR
jgi:hypothetical protein